MEETAHTLVTPQVSKTQKDIFTAFGIKLDTKT